MTAFEPLERTPRRKVWVEVEVDESRPGEQTPRLLHSVDPEKAREAFRDLMSYVSDSPPESVFNANNPFYNPRRTLAQVIAAHGKNPEAIRDELIRQAHERIERDQAAGKATAENADARRERVRGIMHRQIFEQLEGHIGWQVVVAKFLEISNEQLQAEREGDEDAPFFSEAFLYTLIGKDSARSILARLRRLEEALGVPRA